VKRLREFLRPQKLSSSETRAVKESLCEGFEGEEQMFARLIANWVYGGFLAGLLLLLLTPVLVHSWPASLVTTFLCLPVYMVHQYEESVWSPATSARGADPSAALRNRRRFKEKLAVAVAEHKDL
jgi:fatty acid desaturase